MRTVLGRYILFGVLFFFLALSVNTTETRSQASSSFSEPLELPLLIGLHTSGFVGEASVLRREVQSVETFSHPHSLVGIFIDLEAENPSYDIPTALHQLQDNGYTGFVNLTSRRSAAEIATGRIDQDIRKMAQAYQQWVEDAEHPLTFMAPLPEMNGAWETYGQTPGDFKAAYHRIQAIFTDEGVTDESIRWVFAPNGWSESEHGFERYYPGDRTTDIVAFSAYNWGYCRNAAWKQWQSPEVVFGPYVNRMRQMAPNKPIFIAQTATTSMTQSGHNPAAKNEWLNQTYRYLDSVGVAGVIYFNLDKECDWAVYSAERLPANGYSHAISQPRIQYHSPESIRARF